MESPKRFRSSVLVVKNALRFFLNSEKNSTNVSNQKRESFERFTRKSIKRSFQVFRTRPPMFVSWSLALITSQLHSTNLCDRTARWSRNIEVKPASQLEIELIVFVELVEWSCDESFADSSSDIIKNCFLREYVIRNLSVGRKYYVRVSAGNLKGFGQTLLANPPYCIPSSRRAHSRPFSFYLRLSSRLA